MQSSGARSSISLSSAAVRRVSRWLAPSPSLPARRSRPISGRSTRVTLASFLSNQRPGFWCHLILFCRRPLVSRFSSSMLRLRLDQAVTMCDAKGVSVGGERIEAATIIWAAGVMASPAGNWLGAETDTAGRVKVQPDLSIPGLPDIFVAGDTAHCADGQGKPLPGVASVAKQQGEYIARLLIKRAQGGDLAAFRHRDLGMMATIGRKRAVAQVGRLKLTGFVAWVVWCVAHIYFLIGFRNRLSVAMNWLWSYVTFQRGTRLITGLSGSRTEDMPEPPPMELPEEPNDHPHHGEEHSRLLRSGVRMPSHQQMRS